MLTLTQIALSELAGTAVLMALGVGVGANLALPGTGGRAGGTLMGTVGWSLGVFAGIVVGARSGAHLNPAVTLGIIASGAPELAPGVPVGVATVSAYVAGQVVGAVLGCTLAWLAYRQHLDAAAAGRTPVPEPEAALGIGATAGTATGIGAPGTVADPHRSATLGIFATGPGIRSWPHNLMTEAVATFLLVLVLLSLADTPGQLGPLGAALVVLGIGLGMGGPTGWAINPARDLGARLAHALLPIHAKGSSDWGYAWIPVAGPLLGGMLGGAVAALR